MTQETIQILIIAAAVIWTIPWKGVALWKSARAGQKGWFVVMLLLNTLAILEIIYIFFYSKKNQEEIKYENNAPRRVV